MGASYYNGMAHTVDNSAIAALIDEWCAKHNVTQTAFGAAAANDGSLVPSVRAGRNIQKRTIENIEKVLNGDMTIDQVFRICKVVTLSIDGVLSVTIGKKHGIVLRQIINGAEWVREDINTNKPHWRFRGSDGRLFLTIPGCA